MKSISRKKEIEILKAIEIEKLKDREVIERYGISKGALHRLKKRKSEILKDGVSVNEKDSFNEKIYAVFSELRERGVPLSGSDIKRIALKIANSTNINLFKASNGWLEKFKKKFKLNFKALSGEYKSADYENAKKFVEYYESIVIKYGSSNIFNCDETSLFFKTMKTKSFVTANDNCKGYKKTKIESQFYFVAVVREKK